MALGLKMRMKMAHKLVMTPMLQQAIKLLPLARLELAQKVSQELVENPMLEEIVSEENTEEEAEEGVVAVKEEEAPTPKEDIADTPDIDWENYIQRNIDKGLSSDGFTERPSIEATLKSEISLGEHLLWQLRMSHVDESEKVIGAEIIGNINNSGYLECSIEEISLNINVDVKKIEKVLKIIQSFDPTGIGARNLQECLLIQATSLDSDYGLVTTLLTNHINQLEDRFFDKLSKELNVSIQDILDAMKFIRELNPKPATLFISEESQYIIPDVTVEKKDDGYRVFLNDDGLPLMRINPRYQNFLRNKNSNDVKEYLEDKYRSALWLIKSIEQRRQTILKVANSIVKLQKGFFDKGLEHLKPMVLRNVAEDIEMHESTVSRVTTLKYMDTPRGIIDFKFFFHSGVESNEGDATSSVLIKKMIRELIEKEDSAKPITDQQIVDLLLGKKVKVARRTVSKYRKFLHILPANKRRRLYN